MMPIWMMQLTNGKVIIEYVGEYGRHTRVFTNNQLQVSMYRCDTCPILNVWFACDILGIDIEKALKLTSNKIEYDYFKLFKARLMSKYDIMYDRNAVGNAYQDFIKSGHDLQYTIDVFYGFLNYIRLNYKMDNLEIRYKLNEDEIYDTI